MLRALVSRNMKEVQPKWWQPVLPEHAGSESPLPRDALSRRPIGKAAVNKTQKSVSSEGVGKDYCGRPRRLGGSVPAEGINLCCAV